MDSGEAAALCDWTFDVVIVSTWPPLYDCGFWSLSYLAGKGLDHKRVKALMEPTQ